MPNIQEFLGIAQNHLQQREWPQARQIFQNILQNDPYHLPTKQLISYLELQVGQFTESLRHIQELLAKYPKHSNFWHHKGIIHKSCQQYSEAIHCFQQALLIEPEHAQSLFDLSLTYSETKQYEQALVAAQHYLRLYPNSFDALRNYGYALKNNARYAEALEHYNRAIAINGQFAEIYNNRGNVYAALRENKKALADFNQSITVDSHYIGGYMSKGEALKKLGRLAEATDCYKQALAIKLKLPELLHNPELLEKVQRQWSDHIHQLLPGQKLDPDIRLAMMNLGLVLLLDGNYDLGYLLYENRQSREMRCPYLPIWLGTEAIIGKNLALYAEQGLGDTIQFSRFALDLDKMGAKVSLFVPETLFELLRYSFPPSIQIHLFNYDWQQPELHQKQFHFATPLLSLPLALKLTTQTISHAHSYLKVPEDANWSLMLGKKERPRIGLCWRGNPHFPMDQFRSLKIADFLPILTEESKNFEFISLQKDLSTDEIQQITALKIRDFSAYLCNFNETAKLCSQLDLVITVDTSVAHLCGALGLTTWILLPQQVDWRWLRQGNTSIWYQNVRLWRLHPNRSVYELLGDLQHELEAYFYPDAPSAS
ncbi:MAG: tetratricopeptide repeat protein [Gammaproteobacteria bacterium]|nr:tetratricopeptide repeat protein [Gammaproteobacteria bacterium]